MRGGSFFTQNTGGQRMAELTIWKTEEMRRFRRDLGRLFTQVWDDFGMPNLPPPACGVDSVEMVDRGDALVFRAQVPDFDPADLSVRLSESQLTVQGTTRKERVQGERPSQRTRARYGAFTRSIRLPCRVAPEEASATFTQGLLEIVLPKCRSDTVREIEIRVD